MRRGTALKLLVLLWILTTVAGCAGMKDWLGLGSPTAAPTREDSPARPEPLPAAGLARRHMAAGEYAQALADYRTALREQPQDRALAQECSQSMAEIADTADAALQRRDFAAAGRLYYLLRQHQTLIDGQLASPPACDPARLEARLDTCRKALNKQGFQQYRAGDLDGAIGLWEKLLAIDPQNADVQETLRTARLQRKNLEAVD